MALPEKMTRSLLRATSDKTDSVSYTHLDTDLFVGQDLIQLRFQFLPLMYHCALHAGQPHAGQRVHVVADQVHFHRITAYLRS